jgi:hypothetical protein
MSTTGRAMHTAKVGLFGIGLDPYWPQFAGPKGTA